MKMQWDKEMQRGRDEWRKGNKWTRRGSYSIKGFGNNQIKK